MLGSPYLRLYFGSYFPFVGCPSTKNPFRSMPGTALLHRKGIAACLRNAAASHSKHTPLSHFFDRLDSKSAPASWLESDCTALAKDITDELTDAPIGPYRAL